MMSLFGNLLLWCAFAIALLQIIVPCVGFIRQNTHALAFARVASLAQCWFVFAAYALLTVAFYRNDFSIAYVAANSHPSLPLMYRLTAVWGAHEGSVLFWILVLNIWTVAFAHIQKHNSLSPLIIAILGMISFSFLSFLLFTSNPFLPATEMLSGNDLNPLLQDPGFVLHPPMLYTGYVGFSVAFAITQAALIAKKLDASWARISRQFALAAWCFLTLGITLGSWWAYRVLGWGGFWFWDPVENASLLPWIAGTAFIHVLILVEKRGVAVRWAVLLSMITFALSLLGTFLVRSGILISAHTFANDPARGVFLLILLAVLMIIAFTIYTLRIPTISLPSHDTFSLLSRETSLLLNSALLFIAMLTILLGTLYPLIIDALHLGSISVGAPYFNVVMTPLVLLVMFFMGMGVQLHWQTQTTNPAYISICKKMAASIFLALLFLWLFSEHWNVITTLCTILSIWIVLSLQGYFRLSPGMTLAHAGFAMLIIGVLFSSLLNQEHDVQMKPGDNARVGPYEFLFENISGINGTNFRGVRAEFNVTKNDRTITHLYPEKRIYLVRDMVMTKVDIHPGLFRDIYIALGEPLDNDSWSVRLYYKPFIRWIWLGGLIMMIGGFFAALSRINVFGKTI